MQLRWQCAEDPSPRRVLLAGLIPSLAGLAAFVLVAGLAGCSRDPPTARSMRRGNNLFARQDCARAIPEFKNAAFSQDHGRRAVLSVRTYVF